MKTIAEEDPAAAGGGDTKVDTGGGEAGGGLSLLSGGSLVSRLMQLPFPFPLPMPLPPQAHSAEEMMMPWGCESLPGAYALGGGGFYLRRDWFSGSDLGESRPDDDADTTETGLEMNQQQLEPPDSNLPQAWPIQTSVPVATPLQATTIHTSWRKWFDRMLVLFAVVVVALAAVTSTLLVRSLNPTTRHYRHTRSIILDELGKDYFDSPAKERALRWLLEEDPRTAAMAVQEKSVDDTSTIHLVQRFLLASLYFQTTVQQPWKFCNPPVGSESDKCWYESSASTKTEECMAMRWLTESSECQWMGVTCDQGILTGLSFESTIKGATLPRDISRLSTLKEIDLRHNDLSGSIPDEVLEMTSLVDIRLVHNQLTGIFPSQIFSMPNLLRTEISEGQLVGTIPTEIGLFRGTSILISPSQLSGTTPEALYSLTALKMLAIGDTKITGTLSASVGRLTNLYSLTLRRNLLLVGSIPSEIGRLRLTELTITQTGMNGTIPIELYEMKSLLEFQLPDNSLSGTISRRIGELEQMRSFMLENNQMRGTLPTEVGLLKNLITCNVQGNNITGAVPDSLCSNKGQSSRISADCSPIASTELPAHYCPQGCCDVCCDAETRFCKEQ